MSVTWMTKYGLRGVRHDPPTLEEALFAAEGFCDEPEQQIEIAASLMQVPVEEARRQAARLSKSRPRDIRILPSGNARGAVIVEKKQVRRMPMREPVRTRRAVGD